MYHLDNESGVSAMPPISGVSSTTPRWFTENPPSYPGADWYNVVQAELLNVITSAGLTPDKFKLNQLSLAINKIAGGSASITQPGIVQLSNAISSASETTAATSKAVKITYDLANTKQPAGNYADGNIFSSSGAETNMFNPSGNLYFIVNNGNVSGVSSTQYGMIWGFDGAGRLTSGKVPVSQIEGIVQSIGISTQNVMSQKATTDAINVAASVGVNQSWINMTASRTAGVNYTNTTGRPICVILNVKNTLAGLWASNITVSGLEISLGSTTQGEHRSIFAVIPNGAIYSYNPLTSSGSSMWELR